MSELVERLNALVREREAVPVEFLLSGRVTCRQIIATVAKFYKMNLADIYSTRRTGSLAVRRQVAMYLSRMLTTKSYPQIGRCFNKDHATIIEGVRRIEMLIEKDDVLRHQVMELKDRLSA